MNEHINYMNRCLQLAKMGEGLVSPNPMVGAVLVYENRVIGEGFHAKYGQAHAEVQCLQSVSDDDLKWIRQSTLYVSLEPCSHFGKTPPCVDLILKMQIPKVVIACRDSSSKVNGQGIEKLSANGVEVIEGILEKEAQALNAPFFFYEKFKKPYIILKWAQSNDGFIAKKNQQTKISNEFVDRISHRWRGNVDAIFIGYQTALIDNPQLNTRLAHGKNPIRLVMDPSNHLTKKLKIFRDEGKCIVFNFHKNETQNHIEYVQVNPQNPYSEMISFLVERKIQTLLVEGGAATLQRMIDENYWNEARIIHASLHLHDGVSAPILKKFYSKVS
ncbi:MAG: diaminohydroxyphosphoribosylaminopyrimidine deaminase [Bacteroidetes bacterium OLB11]|nr:MAG: diaminohydroxyphosphoribosylaminopyrimidine deaminase [Bacteroidetes bacterium OLB11]